MIATYGTAQFSTDKEMKYRYQLTREWDGDLPVVNFIGLNPSTADALKDDPTIRRCLGFAKRWGFGKLIMTNLFAYRATDPVDLCFREIDPIGPENDQWVELSAHDSQLVVAAWGAVENYIRSNYRFALQRGVAVCERLTLDQDVMCLGRTRSGQPRHPLYLRGDAIPEKYQP